MPFRRLKVRQFYVRLLCALLAGLLPMLLGLVIVIWQTATGVKQDAVARLEHARVMFDRMVVDGYLARRKACALRPEGEKRPRP